MDAALRRFETDFVRLNEALIDSVVVTIAEKSLREGLAEHGCI